MFGIEYPYEQEIQVCSNKDPGVKWLCSRGTYFYIGLNSKKKFKIFFS